MDTLLKWFVAAQVAATSTAEDIRDRARSEQGSEIVAVMLIMGIVAVVCLMIFTGRSGVGNGGLSGAINSLGVRIKTFVDEVV